MMPAMDPALGFVVLVVVGLVFVSASLVTYSLILHIRSLMDGSRRSALEATWRPVILDVVAGVNRVIPREEVLPRDRPLLLDLLLEYARALEYPEREHVERIARPFLPDLIPLIRDRDNYTRAGAVETLGELGYQGHEEEVRRALDDPADVVAFVAARQLAARRNPEHLPILLANLGRFEAWSTDYLASLLTSFGTGAGGHIRRLAIAPDTEPRIRSVAVQALIRLNDLPAADAAAALVEAEADPDLQADLIRLVGRLGRPDHLHTIRGFVDARAPHVRAAALDAIGTLTDGEEGDIALLQQGLHDASPWTALHAARGLKAVGRLDLLEEFADGDGPLALLAGEVLERAT